jgi:glycine cleavage system H protein
MANPENLKYSKEHEWVRVEDGVAVIGITDYAQGELGEIVYIEVDSLEQELSVDEIFGTVEAVKTTSDLFMPVSGKIIAFNQELDESEGDNPGLVNEDPYGEGWIIKVEMSDESEIEQLLSSSEYDELIG